MASSSSAPPPKHITSREPILPSPDEGNGYRPIHIPGVYMRIPKMIGLITLVWLPSDHKTKEEDRVKVGPTADDWNDAVDDTKYGVNSKYAANTVDTKIWGGVRLPGVFVKRDEVVGAVHLVWKDRGVETVVHVSRDE